jgi:hypothetical protein
MTAAFLARATSVAGQEPCPTSSLMSVLLGRFYEKMAPKEALESLLSSPNILAYSLEARIKPRYWYALFRVSGRVRVVRVVQHRVLLDRVKSATKQTYRKVHESNNVRGPKGCALVGQQSCRHVFAHRAALLAGMRE